MNLNSYINKIVRKIRCGAARKKEIKKELWTDIKLRQEQGEKIEDIISQMGTIKEVADGFNENISDKEKKLYTTKKIIYITGFIVLLILVIVLLLYRILPRSADIENSAYFDKQQVEAAVKQTIQMLDDEDYTAMQENAIEQMKDFVNKETMDRAKAQVSDDWGERQSFGTVYMSELIQKNEHFIVTEVAVSYENISVVYRLTYNTDMQLAGIYMR